MVPIDAEDKPVIILWYNSSIFKEKYPKEFAQLVSVLNSISEFGKFDQDTFQFKIL